MSLAILSDPGADAMLPVIPGHAHAWRGPRPGRSRNLLSCDRARRETGTEDRHLHGFRHSVASQPAMNGVSPPVVARRLGHGNVRMTQHYAHVGDREIEVAADRVGRTVAAIIGIEEPEATAPPSTKARGHAGNVVTDAFRCENHAPKGVPIALPDRSSCRAVARRGAWTPISVISDWSHSIMKGQSPMLNDTVQGRGVPRATVGPARRRLPSASPRKPPPRNPDRQADRDGADHDRERAEQPGRQRHRHCAERDARASGAAPVAEPP